MEKQPTLRSLFGMTDEQAMQRVRARDDHEAFACLAERWEEPIRRLCSRMLGDVHRGEDLAQDVFVRVFTRRGDYQPGRKFSTWLWRIALNACCDELRRVRRRGEEGFDEESATRGAAWAGLAAAAREPGEQAAADEEAGLVREALLSLPEDLRAVLILRHYEGLKFREIAAVLEVPEGTVGWRAGEGLKRMHALLSGPLDRRAGANRLPLKKSPAPPEPLPISEPGRPATVPNPE